MKKRTEINLVKVPDTRTMDKLMPQFYDEIVKAVNDGLRIGFLGYIDDNYGEILTKEVLDVTLLQYTYWQVNEDDLLVDVDISVDLTVRDGGGEMEVPTTFCVGLWIDTGDNFRCEYEDVYYPDRKPGRDGILLDRYLVPIFGRNDIEREAVGIWRKYCPEALTDSTFRTPQLLAKRLGLTITSLPLYKKKNVESILFYTDGEVTVEAGPPEERGKEPKTEVVVVPANTIVLNTKADNHDDWYLCIYHECVHFVWHRMFYRLQDKHNSDDSLFEWIEMKVNRKTVPPNPLNWMEFQAERGGYALMLPEPIAREKIEKVYSLFTNQDKIDGYYINHLGWRAEAAIKSLSGSLMLKKFRVKARMKQLGYMEALGAMNYGDQGYATPYGLSEDYRYMSGDNFSINREKMSQLYWKNEAFQKLMATGDYVYADGHVCMNDDRCIRRTPEGLRLTAWANAHVDLCCLNFPIFYTPEKPHEYTFGSINSEAKYNELYNRFLDKENKMTIKERMEVQKKFMDGMPSTFPKALTYVMENRMKVEDLSEKTGISVPVLSRLRNEERSSYSVEQIIIICVAMHLPPWLSDALLERAHLDVKRYGPFGYYREILDCYFMDEVSDVQELMIANGYGTLSTRSD